MSALARAYRGLVLWFAAQFALNLAGQGAALLLAQEPLGGVIARGAFVATLAATVVLAYYGYQTASALGSDLAELWALALLVPCANLLALLALSARANASWVAQGIPVGFLGPKAVPDRRGEAGGEPHRSDDPSGKA